MTLFSRPLSFSFAHLAAIDQQLGLAVALECSTEDSERWAAWLDVRDQAGKSWKEYYEGPTNSFKYAGVELDSLDCIMNGIWPTKGPNDFSGSSGYDDDDD